MLGKSECGAKHERTVIHMSIGVVYISSIHFRIALDGIVQAEVTRAMKGTVYTCIIVEYSGSAVQCM